MVSTRWKIIIVVIIVLALFFAISLTMNAHTVKAPEGTYTITKNTYYRIEEPKEINEEVKNDIQNISGSE